MFLALVFLLLSLLVYTYPYHNSIQTVESLSIYCLSLSEVDNLYTPNTHNLRRRRREMSDPSRHPRRSKIEGRTTPYSLRSKTAPQEAAQSIGLSSQADTPLSQSWENLGANMDAGGHATLCTCTESGCHLNHHVANVLLAGRSTLDTATRGSDTYERQAPAQPSIPRPILSQATPEQNQANKATAFYEAMISAGVVDTNAGKTEDEVVASLQPGHLPPPSGGGSVIGTGLAAMGGAAVGGAVGAGLATLARPPLPSLSFNPSLGGLSLNTSIGLEAPSSPTPSTASLPESPSSTQSDSDPSETPNLEVHYGHPTQSTTSEYTSLVPTTPMPATHALEPSRNRDAIQFGQARSHAEAEPELEPGNPIPNSPPAQRAHAPLTLDTSVGERITAGVHVRAVHRGAQGRGRPLTKIGDHSVHGTDVYEHLLHSQAALPHSEANYIRVMWSRIRDADSNFAYADQSVRMSAYIHPSAPGGGLDPAVEIDNRVLRYHQAPIAQAERRTMDITWCEGFIHSALPISEIMKFYVGGTISERAVTSAIVPKLQPANHNTLRNLSNYLVESVNSINNSGMYAKLMWSVLVRDQYTYAGIQPNATPFADNAAVSYVNLDDNALDYNNIVAPILRGDIVMVERADFDVNDLLAVHYLAQAGRRFDSNPADAIPHTAYVRWPALRVTVLRHGAALAPPQAAVLSSEALMAFAIKLAQQRNEMAHLVEGLYWVMDHAGIRYNVVPDHPQAQFILPDFRITDVRVPRPQDYNVLLRLAGVRPMAAGTDGAEISQFSTVRSQDRVRLVTLYSAAYTIFATTVLHSIQVAGDRLREWYGGLPITPAANTILTQLNNITQPTAAGAEAPIFNMIKDCYPKFLGVEVVRNVHRGNMWLGSYGSRAAFEAAYHGLPTVTTPRLLNPLIIDNFLIVRPREWGITGPCPKVDVHKEVILQAMMANQGWRALRGSEEYQRAATGSMPFCYVEYGAFAVNTITQYLRPEQQLLSVQDAYYSPNGVAEFAPPHPLAGPQYIAAIHTFMPCTIMTWDSVNLTVRAIAISRANIPHHDLLALSNLRGQELQSAGLALAYINQGGGTYQMPNMFSLPSMFGQPPPAVEAVDIQPTQSEN